MSAANPNVSEQARRIAEATAWHMRLRDAELETMPEFEAWLADPSNAEIWAQTIALWGFLGEQARAPEMVAAREHALGTVRRAMARRRRSFSGRRVAATAAIAFLTVMAGWAGFRWLAGPDDYATAFGERRVVTLADGSRVSLDSDSEVTVRYSRLARELHLLKGQARFDVAHDVQRPFSVVAGDQKVVATGTAFNIDMTEPKVRVTLIEGHVVVFDEDKPRAETVLSAAAPAPVELHAGQQLIASVGAPPEIAPANVQRVTAWTAGQLIFTNEPLSDVVARVNHYSNRPISLADADLGRERVTGVFNTGDVAGFLEVVTGALPVEATTGTDGQITLKKKL